MNLVDDNVDVLLVEGPVNEHCADRVRARVLRLGLILVRVIGTAVVLCCGPFPRQPDRRLLMETGSSIIAVQGLVAGCHEDAVVVGRLRLRAQVGILRL